MKIIGQILMWSGFLGGAFCAVLRAGPPEGTASGSGWSTIPWLWYLLSVSGGVVGVILLRVAAAKDKQDDGVTEFEYSTVQRSLEEVSNVVVRLCSQAVSDPRVVVSVIDNECVEPLADFANARQALEKRFGMTIYADVMTEFASAERFLNRAWSAAADGYVDEVEDCLDRANSHLASTREIIGAADLQAG
ncbi:MAG: hypothetical protein ACPGPS_07435 [Rubripirellula sp.]|jgi:hypothetical protein